MILVDERRVEEALGLADAIGTQPDGHAVGQRHIDHELKLGALVLEAVSGVGEAGELLGGDCGNHIDRAADCVTAVERALCAAQHLNPADIEQVRGGKVATAKIAAAADVGTVAIEPDRRLGGRTAAGARAAKRDFGVGRGAGVEVAQARHSREKGLDIADTAARLKAFDIQHRGGHGHVAQTLLALAGSDQHLANGHLVICRAGPVRRRLCLSSARA